MTEQPNPEPEKKSFWAKLKFWKKKNSKVQKTEAITKTFTDNKQLTNYRSINDVHISTVEGLSETKAIHVTAWSSEDALNLYREIRKELKK
jgi:hypothetical protein